MSSLFSICRHLKNVKNRVQDMLSCRPSRYYRQHQLIAIICYLLEELRSSVTHSLCLIQNRGNLLQLCSRVGLMTCFKLEFYLLVWKLYGICLNMDHKYKYVCIPVWNYYNYVFLVRNSILIVYAVRSMGYYYIKFAGCKAVEHSQMHKVVRHVTSQLTLFCLLS